MTNQLKSLRVRNRCVPSKRRVERHKGMRFLRVREMRRFQHKDRHLLTQNKIQSIDGGKHQ